MDGRHNSTDLTNLPVKLGEVWQVHAKRVSSYDVASVNRPWCVLIISTTTDSLLPDDLVVSYELVDEFPTPSVLWETIERAILAPSRRRPSRPSVIEFRSREYCEALRPKMVSAFIRGRSSHRFDCWNSVFEAIMEKPAMGAIPSPLLAPGASLAALERFVTAAATFYEQLPAMPSRAVIDVTRDGHSNTCWRGLISDSDENKLTLVEVDGSDSRSFSSLRDTWRQSVSLSVSFGHRHRLPTCYRRAIELNHWRIAASNGYPVPIRTNPGATVRAPLAWELELLTRVLEIVPDMLVLHRKDPQVESDRGYDPRNIISGVPRLIVTLNDATDG